MNVKAWETQCYNKTALQWLPGCIELLKYQMS